MTILSITIITTSIPISVLALAGLSIKKVVAFDDDCREIARAKNEMPPGHWAP